MKKLISLLAITLITLNCLAQDQHLVDSLTNQLKIHKQDTTTANILVNLSYVYWGINPDKANNYANQCLSLSEQIGYKKGIADAYNSLGVNEWYKGNYLHSMEFYKKALKIYQEIGLKKGIAISNSNIGIIYDVQGNYPEALKYYFASLKMNEEIGNKNGIANSYSNIGIIYDRQGNYPEALKNHFASLKINEEIGDKQGIAYSYTNIGVIYDAQSNYPEALKNHFASLKINEEIGNKIGIATAHGNIGIIYEVQGNYPEALKNHFASLKIREEIGDKDGTALSFICIGEVYTKEKKYNEASVYLNKGLLLAKEIGSLECIKSSYNRLATLDSAKGDYSKAFEHYKLFITYRDSLINTENTKKTMAMQMNYDFDKKEEATKVAQEKKDIKQRNIRNFIAVGLALALIFLMVVFRQRNKISKARKRSDELLLNILPAEIAEELKQKGSAEAQLINEVTVLFTDFKGFTQLSENLTPKQLVAEINDCFSAFDHITHKYGIEKIKTIGDSYMAAGGLPTPNKTHANDVLIAALEIQQFMKDHKIKKEKEGALFFEIRIGIHSGPVVAGIVGVKKFAYDIWGDTVNTASRMESSGEVGQVNISGTTYEIIKNDFKCVHRGKIQAKGKGEIDMYFVIGKV